ncbi:MAG: GNAT family N-acetyltransferase [Rhodothermales bacterium]
MKEHEAMDTRFVLSDDADLRWKNDFPLWIDDLTRRIVVAELGGRIIGFIQAHRRLEPPVFRVSPEVYIDEIYVLPSIRDQGVGKQLLDYIKEWAEALGSDRIRLKVLAANQKGIAFWEREGAAPIDLAYTIELEPTHQEEKKVRTGKLGF